MINIKNVVKSYNGSQGCMCGCKGIYTLPEGTDLKAINKSYGFEHYTTENVSDRRVKTAVNKINKALAMSENELEEAGLRVGTHDGFKGEKIAFLEKGSRSTVVYYN